jgi:hypothetical protein
VQLVRVVCPFGVVHCFLLRCHSVVLFEGMVVEVCWRVRWVALIGHRAIMVCVFVSVFGWFSIN